MRNGKWRRGHRGQRRGWPAWTVDRGLERRMTAPRSRSVRLSTVKRRSVAVVTVQVSLPPPSLIHYRYLNAPVLGISLLSTVGASLSCPTQPASTFLQPLLSK